MAKRKKTSEGTQAQSHEGTKQKGLGVGDQVTLANGEVAKVADPGDASAAIDVSPPWDAEGAGDVPMEGEVRALMLERIASGMPESERAGFVAYVEKHVDARDVDAGEGVSFNEAGQMLGDYMAARLAELHAKVGELAEKLRTEGTKPEVTESRSHEVTAAPLASGSLVDVVVGAVRARVDAIRFPVVTADHRRREPGAGLEGMNADACRKEIERIGDPVAILRGSRERLDTLAIDLGKAIKDAKLVVAEAIQAITESGTEAHRFDLERARLARVRIASIEAERAKADEVAEAERVKKLVAEGKITL